MGVAIQAMAMVAMKRRMFCIGYGLSGGSA
jgi:hypothetical protein